MNEKPLNSSRVPLSLYPLHPRDIVVNFLFFSVAYASLIGAGIVFLAVIAYAIGMAIG
ncbi:MAG: hypothetical protein KDD70_02985 [Bdellovibrionales bacterium]|nr:hypothetical protein [Bdellovibrionales bacterium]